MAQDDDEKNDDNDDDNSNNNEDPADPSGIALDPTASRSEI